MESVGIDILEVERFIDIADNDKKLSKIFTKNEICYFKKFSEKLTHIAGHFCAKEAVSKALKIGFGKELSPIDIEICHNSNGAPFVNQNNVKFLKLLNGRKIEISISHSKTYATSICILD